MHACKRSFCRECIEGALGPGTGGFKCPACMGEGRQTLLGANPWAAGRLQPDFVLDALLRKLLPEDVRQHLIWQRVQVGIVPCPGSLCHAWSMRRFSSKGLDEPIGMHVSVMHVRQYAAVCLNRAGGLPV